MTGYVSTQWTFPILTTEVQDGLTTTRTVTSDFLLQPELQIVILNPSSQCIYQRNDTVVGDINQDVLYFTEDYELASSATLGTYVAKIRSVPAPFVVYQVRTIRTVVTRPETTATTQYVTTEVCEFRNKALLIVLALVIGWPVLARGFGHRSRKSGVDLRSVTHESRRPRDYRGSGSCYHARWSAR